MKLLFCTIHRFYELDNIDINTNFGSRLVTFNIYNNIDKIKYTEIQILPRYNFDFNTIYNYDKILFGGDQIFYPRIFDKFYQEFLTLNKLDNIYIYGSSFGEIRENNEDYIHVRDFVNRINNIKYLRENYDFLNLTNCEYCLDPIFLSDADYYSSICKQYKDYKPQSFTFGYFPPHSEVPQNTSEIDIVSYDIDKKLSNPLNLTIYEFLCLIKNCKVFYTTSFHGFLLALMFNKKIVLQYKYNNRIKYFLNKFKLDYTNPNEVIGFNNTVKTERNKIIDFIRNF